ncbi:benzoate/H(+) symporter BenE family transporter [Verminephrobacter eiseniae]|uniref:benzoate/H(+) symporter BenE family transporter n=1 Tax=Verminephrobacter eiseniae TaxID=364317 RepID=UPI0022375CEB|nr:benzoate/H(+) symporter BenE family transporter [Verminephrobacter eiseniae]
MGAYLVAGTMVLLLGITGVFDAFIKKIPQGISAGLLAGVLLNFGWGALADASMHGAHSQLSSSSTPELAP